MIVLPIISDSLSVSPNDVIRISRSAPHRYKVYSVPKRSGRGIRIIAQPSRELKAIQRCLIKEVLHDLPIHDAATAYSSGCNIRINAELHINNNYLLKMDFSDFFPSIKPKDFTQHLNKYASSQYSPDDISLMVRLLFWSPKRDPELILSIGAPSSPFISNTIMYDFDTLVSERCSELNVIYSRYADDIVFSCNEQNILSEIHKLILDVVGKLEYPKLRINHDKSIYTSKKHHRTVTGIVLSSQGKLSLGRTRKRLIRSMIYRFINDLLVPDECMKLRGLLAFAKDVDSDFYNAMTNKYGSSIINRIIRYTHPQ